jgi:uncharacterized RDD family membrane protein YckC
MTEPAACPKCGFARDPRSVECPACGIIFSRYDPGRREAQREARASQAAHDLEGSGETNPYRAPEAVLVAHGPADDVFGQPLASRGARLGAYLLDNLFALPAILPILIALPFIEPQSENPAPMIAGCAVAGVLIIGLLVANLYFLARDGQTLGKKAVSVRIVRLNGERVSLGRILVLRYIVPGLLGAIPFLGYVFSLLNYLLIFREDRRCLHDHIADTKVVMA